MLDVRLDHGAQRLVLQVRELRYHERLRVGRRFAPRLPELQGSLKGGWPSAAGSRWAGASRPFWQQGSGVSEENPAFVRANNELHDWRHAIAVLSTDFRNEWADVLDC